MTPLAFALVFFASPSSSSSSLPPPVVSDIVEWIQVDGGGASDREPVHLRVLTRTLDERRPALVYQPFAASWPQLNAAVFLPLLDAFTLVTYDPRGVGGSTGTFDASRSADDLEAVVLYAKAGRARREAAATPQGVYVLAISSGAEATLLLSQRRPDALAGVALVSPVLSVAASVPHIDRAVQDVWGVPPWLFRRLPLAARITLLLARMPYHRCHARIWCSGEFYNPWTYADSAYYPRPVLTYLQASAGLFGTPLRAVEVMHLTSHRVPVHVMWGEHDRTFSPAPVCADFAARLTAPATRATVLPNASHAAHLEQPERFREAVRAMLPTSERSRRAGGRDPPWTASLAPRRAERRYDPPKVEFEVQAAGVVAIMTTALFARTLAPWVSRKIVHVGIGTLLVHADLQDWRVRALVHAATAVTLGLTALGLLFPRRVRPTRYMRFLHDRRVDPGVTFYVSLCSALCALRVDFVHFLPFFWADPMGAIVGRNLKGRTRVLYGSKTLAGTAAVWTTAFVTLVEPDAANRVVGATVVAVVELLAGDWDNPAIGAFLAARAVGYA